MSGGYVKQNPVEVATESALVPTSLNKLYQAKLFQKMQVPLDGSGTAVERSGNTFHLWPAQPCFVVGVIR
jgi:hypothetical protein